jgi:hypothetical protein
MSACLEYSASNLWPLGPLFTPSAHLDFGLPWFVRPFCLALNSGTSSDHIVACLFDIMSIRVVKLFIEFMVVPPLVDTIYASFEEPFSQIRTIGSSHFWSTPKSHCRGAGLGGSGSCEWWIWSSLKGGSTGDVCAFRRSTYLQSGFFVVFPDSRYSFVSSGIRNGRVSVGVRGVPIEFWRRLYMSRSRGKFLDSIYNRVYRPSGTLDTGHNTPSSFLVMSR